MPETDFYFASTPLHIFLASAIALSRPARQHVMLLIDQPNVTDNFYYRELKHWPSTPFHDLFLSEGKISGSCNKVRSRKKTFHRIKQMTEHYLPNQVFTGSDKRLEFQYCMHILNSHRQGNDNAHGIYIDEGTFSYLPPSFLQQLSQQLFETVGKKLIYGNWYKNTPFTGGSAYTSHILAAYPDLLHKGLAKKNIKQFDQRLLEQPELSSFADLLLNTQNMQLSDVEQFDIIVTLPHQSLLADSATKANWKNLLKQLGSLNKEIAVKYHPRDNHQDLLGLAKRAGITVIPRKILFEALLPGLKTDAHIIGDFSSVLLNVKWLRPTVSVNAVLQNNRHKDQAFIHLYERLGIDIFSQDLMPALINHLSTTNAPHTGQKIP